MKKYVFTLLLVLLTCLPGCKMPSEANLVTGSKLNRVLYNNPGLSVDVGVGLWAWPVPIDYDRDGDLDLIVSCPDKPFNGTYFFENPDGALKMPVFLPPVKIGEGKKNILVSYVDDQPRILNANIEYEGFRENVFSNAVQIYPKAKIHDTEGRIRFNTWRYNDFNGDGAMDIIASVDDWGDYGWDNAFNEKGEWQRGPLHGYVYIILNKGSTADPDYSEPFRLLAGEKPVDVYGAPFGDLADFDGDGDLDLICGEFLDGFTYFENKGTRTEPIYSEARRLSYNGQELNMDLQMITPTAVDWDGDGDVDLVVGDEDGRVALIENTGETIEGMPQFLPPAYFQQQAQYLKFGALATPVGVDWDGDGDEDLVCGNSAGYIGFFENLDGKNPPKWAPPVRLEAGGETIRIQAGVNGSIQGPAEAKWGYTTLNVADWDHDGLKDLVVNSIWGKVIWYRNLGGEPDGKPGEADRKPVLDNPQPILVEWTGEATKPEWNWWDPDGKELATQWRTTPVVWDQNEDGLNDLVMLDHEGFLAFFQRTKKDGQLLLMPGERIFTGRDADRDGNPVVDESGLLRLNPGIAGKSGRRKICVVDWDGDGLEDLLVNSKNVNFLKNMGDSAGFVRIRYMGLVDSLLLAGHTTSPTIVDWNKDGQPDLLVGAEDGHFYYLENPGSERDY
ncbi:FG-GAP repeat domain-containing protein [Bacteroidota bacterium]